MQNWVHTLIFTHETEGEGACFHHGDAAASGAATFDARATEVYSIACTIVAKKAVTGER